VAHGIDWWISRLEGVEEQGEDSWVAWCPSHDDVGTGHKGLSLRADGDKVLAHCHSEHGCTFASIRKALENSNPQPEVESLPTRQRGAPRNFTVSFTGGLDWWSRKTGVTRETLEHLPIEEDGRKVVFTFPRDVRKFRGPPKEMSWEGEPAPLLWPFPGEHLPEEVWITEGESDACTAFQLGHAAFAVTKGAGAPPDVEMLRTMRERGVRRLVAVGDADKSGQKFQNETASRAVAAGIEARVVNVGKAFDPFAGLTDLNDLYRRELARNGGDVAKTITDCNAILDELIEPMEPRLVAIPGNAFLDFETEDGDWVIPNLIAKGDKVLVIAPQKSYKTWITLDLVRSVVACRPFMQRAEWIPDDPMRVGFVEEEGSKRSFARRLSALQLGDALGNVVVVHRRGFRFTDPECVEELDLLVKREELGMVVLDPLQRMIPGLDENSASDVAIVWDSINELQLRNPGLVVLLIHHAAKNKELGWDASRGSSRHAGEVDIGLFVQRDPDEKGKLRISVDGRDIPEYLGTGEHFSVNYEIHMSDEPSERYFVLDATEIQLSVRHENSPEPEPPSPLNRGTLAVFDSIRQASPCTVTELAARTGLSRPTIYKHLKHLEQQGLIAQREGRYAPTPRMEEE
jgi:hypothetical protein